MWFQIACEKLANPDEGKDGLEGKPTPAIAVETYILNKGEVVEKIISTGTIVPIHDVLVSSETSGTIIAIYVEVGDWLERGDSLIQIDPELKQLSLDQAEAGLIEAKAAKEKSSKDFERNKKLFVSKDISEYIFENARLKMESAQSYLLMAQANVKMAMRQLKDTRIVSPINGFVAVRLVELGGTVAPGTPIAKIVDISKIKVKFGVPENDIVKIKKRNSAVITLDTFPEEKFIGIVTAVGPQADLATRSFPVEVLVKNPGNRLKAGMVAKVEVLTNIMYEVPLLPKSALLERSGQTFIFVIKKNIAEKRTPDFGLEKSDKIALISGAEVGEEVVILGQENLTQGVPVNVVKRHK